MMKKYLPIYMLFVIFNIHSQEISISPEKYKSCGFDEKSKQLAKLLMESKGQKRISLSCNAKLAKAANQKARDMAEAQKVAHYINNVSPNELLKKEGVELPFKYEIIGNQVESVSGGMRTAQKSFDHFMTSLDHKSHLLGENNFYQKQDQIGVGHYIDQTKKHVDYWVVYITSLRAENDKLITASRYKPSVFKPKVQKQKGRFCNSLGYHWSCERSKKD